MTMTIAELEALVSDATERIDALTPKPTPEPYTTYEKEARGTA